MTETRNEFKELNRGTGSVWCAECQARNIESASDLCNGSPYGCRHELDRANGVEVEIPSQNIEN